MSKFPYVCFFLFCNQDIEIKKQNQPYAFIRYSDIPSVVKARIAMQNSANHRSERRRLMARREWTFTHENDHARLVHDFIQDNGFRINGTQCLQMLFQSKNVSMLHHLDRKTNNKSTPAQSNSIQEQFNRYYESFAHFQQQQLRHHQHSKSLFSFQNSKNIVSIKITIQKKKKKKKSTFNNVEKKRKLFI